MRNYTLQSLFAPKKRLLLLIFLCFSASIDVNGQNLITNGGFESGNKVGYDINGFGYNFVTGMTGSSNSGEYALISQQNTMNSSTFLSGTDHTNPGSGKMMVIDGNTNGGQQRFYKAGSGGGGICGLTVGATYTFTYYIKSVSSTVVGSTTQADIGIQINNADAATIVLATGSTVVPLPGGGDNWMKVSYTFKPTNACVNIELWNNNTNPVGNDFAIDDISLIGPPLPLSISTSQTAISCPGLNDGSISAYGFGGVQPYSYKLTPPVGLAVTNSTGIFTNLASGPYKVEVFDSNSPVGSDFKNVTINSVLDMTIAGSIPANSALVPASSSQPLSTTICAGNTITLVANNMTGYTWSATPADATLTVPNSASISVTPTQMTVYKVTATGPTGALSNLVYNGDFENDVAGFSSDYRYLATNPAFEKRTYGVITNPNIWGSVYDSSQDHTNPGTGKFFITDGSTSTPTIDKVWGQNIAVKSGVTYDFNYFLRTITSTSPTLPAKMQLKINGVVINNSASSSTDVAPATTAGGWVTYKHTWTAGVGVTIATIELYDIETSGAGNDFGLDDITFIAQGVPTCTVSKEITVNISPGTSDTAFTYPAAVCQTSTTLMPTKTTPATFTSGGTWSKSSSGGTLSINSSTGEINPSLSTAGAFTVKYEVLQDLSICQAASSSTFNISINAQPDAGTAGSITVCESSATSISLASLITGEQSGGTWSRTTGTGGTFNIASGIFTPAVGATTSTFTYTLTGTFPCVNSSSVATVNINPQPVAGTSGNTTVCESSVTSISLASLIIGEQTGGTWTRTTGAGGTFNAASGTFIPAVGATTSTFTYTLTGTSPCVNSSSVATVNINPQPVAGTSGNTTVCESSATSINLSSLITGEQAGGTWTRTTGTGGTFNAASGTYTPAVGATTSTFTYSLMGTSPCVNSSSIATVNVNPQPVAGTSGNATVCESSATSINLSSLITGEQAGGTWTRTTGTGGTFNAASGTYTPAVGATTSTFTYSLMGTSPCVNSSSIATVNVNPQPVAGTSGNATVCESSTTSINLFSLITGEQAGGTWTRPTGTGGTFNAASGTYTPAVGATTSTFTYTLVGTSPCINSSSTATVNINPQPVSGTSGNITVCESSVTPISLFSLITGEQVGGTWTRTTGAGGTFNAASGTFTPAVGATTSTFTYTLIGTSPCINSSSVATVNINPQPVAGTSGNTTVCESSVTPISLSSLITGEQAGGTWTRTTGTGGTFNGASGTFTPAVGATTSSFTYTLVGTFPCVNSSSVATVNINPQPVAGTSGNTTVCDSNTALIDLYSLITAEQAGGAWSRTAGVGGTFNAASGEFTPAVGATTSTFTYSLVGTFPCVNSSSVATVNINPVPTLSINCGTPTISSVTFNWNTISGATSYNYSYSIDGSAPITGSGPATTLTINSLMPGQNVAITVTSVGNTCVTTGSGNCVSSNCPTPIVNPIADITTICANGTVLVPNFTSPDSGVIFNWASNNASIGIPNNGTGNITSFTAINATAVVQTATISVTAFNGTCTGPAKTFKIGINPLPVMSISGTTSICSGTGTNITFSGTPNTTVTYTINGGSNQTIVLDVTGSAILPTGNLTVNTDYSLISALNSSTTCSQIQTGTATITIDPLPTVSILGTTSICSGTGTNITFSGTPDATVTYTINGGANQTIVLDAVGSAILPTGNLTANTVYNLVSVLNSSTNCSQVQVGTATITINPLPIATISGTTAICSGTGTNITFSGTPDATVTYTVNGGANQTIVLDVTGFAILPTGNLTADVVYDLVSALNSSTTCSQVQTGTATITINPLPTVSISGTTSICSGTGTNITFLGTPDATVTFTVNSGANQTIILDAAGTAILSTGNLTTNTVYSLVSVLNSTTTCSQLQTGTATITIDPLPTASISGTTSICSGTGTNITFSGMPNARVTYTVNGSTNQTIVLDGTGSAILPTGNLTANTVYSLVSALNSSTTCSQLQTGTATITIDPLPIASISGTTSICSGAGTNITFSGTPDAIVTYTVNGGANQTIVLDVTGFAILPTGNLTTDVVYDLVSALNSSTNCSQVQTGTATITINPLPTVSISGTTSICSGTGTNITFTGTPNTTVTYTVNSGVNQAIVLDTVGSAILPTGNLTTDTDYSLVSVLNSATNCSQVQTGTATITIDPLPIASISGTTSICSGTGTNIAFSGTPNATVTYTVNGGADQTIVLDAAGSAILPTGNLTADTDYSLVSVLNSVTSCSQVQTGTATITINPLPTVSISGTTSICSGTGTNITFTGTPNATVTYTVNTGVNQTIVLDAVGSAILPTGNLTADVVYSLVNALNSSTTCSQVQTGTATVTIDPLPTVNISGTTSICFGTGTNITFSGTPNATVTYTVNGGANQTIILDVAGSAILSTGNLTVDTDYSLVSVLNSTTNCSQVQTGTATITVIPLPTIVLTSTNVTASQNICINTVLDTITYTIGGSATGATVVGLPAGVTSSFAAGVVTISGTPAVSGTFNYIVDTTGGCSPPATLEGTIAVKPLSTLVLSTPAATTSQTICFNDAIASILYTVGGSATSVVASGLPSGVTGNLVSDVFTISGTPIAPGTYNYSVITVGGCSPAITLNGTITVNPLPIADFTGTTAICSGDLTAIALSSTIIGTTFSWNSVQNNVTGASSSSGSVINQTLTATGSNMGQVVYNVTPIVGSCIGLPKMITINVSPVPNVIENTAKKTLCSGETTSIDLSSAIVGTTFSWTVNATGVTGATSGSGNKIMQLLSNAGFVPGTVDYVITPSINGCVGTSVTVTITVNPLPEVLGTPPGVICSGYSTNITLSPTIAGTTFDWTVVQLGVTGATSGTGNTISQILETTGTSQGNVIYTITPSLNGCIGTPLDITVNVNPSPRPIIEDGVICVEQATGVAFKTYTLDSGLSASKYNFQWYFNSQPISGASSSTFDAAQSGDYKVQVINNLTGCDATSETAKVIASFPGLAIVTNQTLAFSDNAKVEVIVTGGDAVFEYQLDGGSFQSSNVFEYLKPGPHSITVGDENGCTNLTQNFFVIGYPKFFSPNGDGHNDTWNVVGLDGQPKSNIFIFDRYGKLIKQISPNGEGWDGNYTGQPLPATDYWFTVEFSEQSETKLFKAHFSLIR